MPHFESNASSNQQLDKQLIIAAPEEPKDMKFILDSENRDNWRLCEKAEPRLMGAIKDNGVIVIGEQDDPLLLLKFSGRISALALRDFSDQNGKIFREGSWYSPKRETKKLLVEAFEGGQGRIVIPEGEWVAIRPLEHSYINSAEVIFNTAMSYARTTPGSFSDKTIRLPHGDIVTRTAYYRMNFEPY